MTNEIKTRRIMNGYVNPADIGNNFNDTDSYKYTHDGCMPEKVMGVWTYQESRTGAIFGETKFFGLQYILNQLQKPLTMKDADRIIRNTEKHGTPINPENVYNIMNKYNGLLPVEIGAIPEGMVVPISNAVMYVKNTCLDDGSDWVTNFTETQLSRIWYTSGVATLSYHVRKLLKRYLDLTADDDGILNFQLHDFGSRGVSCREQAAIGGMAHLAAGNLGTDTYIAMDFANVFYDAPEVCGYSVIATEHSVMTSLGEAGEEQLFLSLLMKYPNKILSVVIDSYNYQRFISVYARKYKNLIEARGAKLVFRPDSGEPVETSLDVYRRIKEVFGATINSKGYEVLNPKVGMLWGDGIDIYGIERILTAFFIHKISSCNIIFGMGGKLLYSFMNRDSMRSAMKCSAQFQEDNWINIQKNPLDQSKKSKSGLLGLIYDSTGTPITVEQNDPRFSPDKNIIVPVFNTGKILKYYTWDDVLKQNKV